MALFFAKNLVKQVNQFISLFLMRQQRENVDYFKYIKLFYDIPRLFILILCAKYWYDQIEK